MSKQWNLGRSKHLHLISLCWLFREFRTPIEAQATITLMFKWQVEYRQFIKLVLNGMETDCKKNFEHMFINLSL